MKRNIIFFISVSFISLFFVPILLTQCSSCIGFNNEACSQIGDTIGGTTAPIIGFVSIILLYVTLNEQLKFNERQDEFNKAQLEFAKVQKKFAFDQQFKTTFFTLLHNFRGIAENIRPINRDEDFFFTSKYRIKAIFKIFENPESQEFKEIRAYYKIGLGGIRKYRRFIESGNIENQIKLVYTYYYLRHTDVGVYFRSLYHLLKYIDDTKNVEINMKDDGESEEAINQKYLEYAKLVQAQMSVSEFFLLFYDCFSYSKTKELVKKYKLLDNLNKESLAKPDHDCIPEFNLINAVDYYRKLLTDFRQENQTSAQ